MWCPRHENGPLRILLILRMYIFHGEDEAWSPIHHWDFDGGSSAKPPDWGQSFEIARTSIILGKQVVKPTLELQSSTMIITFLKKKKSSYCVHGNSILCTLKKSESSTLICKFDVNPLSLNCENCTFEYKKIRYRRTTPTINLLTSLQVERNPG